MCCICQCFNHVLAYCNYKMVDLSVQFTKSNKLGEKEDE